MIETEKISNTVHSLLYKDFTIRIEDGTVIGLRFRMHDFFHLLGFHYLKDLPDVSKPRRKDEVVRRFLRGTLSAQTLEKSTFFHKIQKRIELFSEIEKMLVSNRCKIIVDFDPSLIKATWLRTKYFLFRTEDHATYMLFGIGRDQNRYYPETFIVEPSKYYVTGQRLLDCTIQYTEHMVKRRNQKTERQKRAHE